MSRRLLLPKIGITVSLVALGYSPTGAATQSQPLDPSCYGPTIQDGTLCPGEETNAQSAINTPTIYAWATFAQLNQPAFPGNSQDTRRVWETWKSADYNGNPAEAIYLDNGHQPQVWRVEPGGAPPKVLVPIQQLQALRKHGRNKLFLPTFIPMDPMAQEVRMNRPAFNFIREKGLYNLEAIYRYASRYPNFDFPQASKEVKAIWLEANPALKIADYYSGSVGGKTYVLVAMHVTTKDIPFWHWSSFIHKDQNKDPASDYEAPLADNQGVPASLLGTPFENYRLIAELVESAPGLLSKSGKGAQIQWLTRVGLKTVMGNPQIERTIEPWSSCITCHAHSAIGTNPTGAVIFADYPELRFATGAVKPEEFVVDGQVFYPLDFVWSFSQAKSFQP